MKKSILSLILMVFLLISIANISAITGSIGNARMILRADSGQVIEKYVLVKNVNDEYVDIQITASGDLEDSINIIDNEFRLQPGEEKKAHFKISAIEKGTYESRINVRFTPAEGNGVGLTSTVILITDGGGEINSDNNQVDQGTNPVTGAFSGTKKNTTVFIVGIITFVLLVVLLILLIYFNRTKKHWNEKKEVNKIKKSVKSRGK